MSTSEVGPPSKDDDDHHEQIRKKMRLYFNLDHNGSSLSSRGTDTQDHNDEDGDASGSTHDFNHEGFEIPRGEIDLGGGSGVNVQTNESQNEWKKLPIEECDLLYFLTHATRKNKNWIKIINKMQEHLNNNYLLDSKFISEVFKLILKHSRISKVVEKASMTFICNYFTAIPTDIDYIYDILYHVNNEIITFQKEYWDANNLYHLSPLIETAIEHMYREQKLEFKEKPVSSLFYILTLIMEKLYLKDSKFTMKIRLPFVLRVFQNEEFKSFNSICEQLFIFMWEISDFKKEFSLCMRWLVPIIKYLEDLKLPIIFDPIVEFLVELNNEKSIIDKIWDPLLGQIMCQQIILQNLPELTQIYDDEYKIKQFLTQFSALEIIEKEEIAQVPQKLDAKYFFNFDTIKVDLSDDSRSETSSSISPMKRNRHGESRLHKFCKSKDDIPKFKHLLKKLAREDFEFDINVKDFNDNTVLHDICYSGNSELLVYLWSTEYIQANNPKSLDILAVNKDGYTALHEAVSSNKEDIIETLLNIASAQNKKEDLLKIRNKEGDTALQMAINSRSIPGQESEAEKNIKKNCNRFENIKNRYFVGKKLPEKVFAKLQQNNLLLRYIGYWRSFKDREHEMNKKRYNNITTY